MIETYKKIGLVLVATVIMVYGRALEDGLRNYVIHQHELHQHDAYLDIE